MIQNRQTKKEFILDSCVEDESILLCHLSRNNVGARVKKINDSKEIAKKLALDNFAINFAQLEDIQNKEAITEIEISRAYQYMAEGPKFEFLDRFPNVTSLAIYSTASYQTHLAYSFDSKLQELIIIDCSITQHLPLGYPNLLKLELCKDGLTEVPVLSLPKLEYLNLSHNRI